MRLAATDLVICVLAAFAPAPAAAQSCTAPSGAPSIAGVYVDNYGGVHSVSQKFWLMGAAVFETCSLDETTKRIVAQNSDRNDYFPGEFSRFDWTTSDGGTRLWYCQIVYQAHTAAEAASAPAPDPATPWISGCGGAFAWSQLIKLLPGGW